MPVFGIILAGYLCGRFRVLGEASSEALNRFVYFLALPALFFISMARVPVGAPTVRNTPDAVVPGEVLVGYKPGANGAQLALSITPEVTEGYRGRFFVLELEPGQEEAIRGRFVINAAGPWLDAVCDLLGQPRPRKLGGTKGSHLVVRQQDGLPRLPLYTPARSDERVVAGGHSPIPVGGGRALLLPCPGDVRDDPQQGPWDVHDTVSGLELPGATSPGAVGRADLRAFWHGDPHDLGRRVVHVQETRGIDQPVQSKAFGGGECCGAGVEADHDQPEGGWRTRMVLAG